MSEKDNKTALDRASEIVEAAVDYYKDGGYVGIAGKELADAVQAADSPFRFTGLGALADAAGINTLNDLQVKLCDNPTMSSLTPTAMCEAARDHAKGRKK